MTKAVFLPTEGPDGTFKSPPGIALKTTPGLTTRRMKRILAAYGLTGEQHAIWVGWPMPKYATTNPSLSERDWHQLLLENLELFVSPPELTVRG